MRTTNSSASPKLSVTIVNHRARDLVRECIDSLMDHPYTLGDMEIVVLDNASDDGSVEMLASEYPDVVVVAERRRRGFGANQNRAVAASTGDVVFVLNPDARVEEHTLDRLVAALDWDPRTAAAGGPIANDDGSLRQDRPHRFPTPTTSLQAALGAERLASRSPAPATVTRTGWPSGAAFVVKREAFDAVGGFDESFFMYSEDADLFTRMIDAGYVIAWDPEAVVIHPYPDESEDLTARRETEILRAELQYMHKHFGGNGLFRSGVALGAGLKLGLLSTGATSRLVKTHGKDRAQVRRVESERLRAALRRDQGPGLADLAHEWNRSHGVTDEDEPVVFSGEPSPATMGDLVVLDTGTTWSGPWIFQHVAVHLSSYAPVLWVDTPDSPIYSYRTQGTPRLRPVLERVGPDLYVFRPVGPPGVSRPGMSTLNAAMLRRSVADVVERLDTGVHSVMASVSAANLFDAVDAKVRVFYASDDFRAGAELTGMSAGRIRALDDEMASKADQIIAISPVIADAYRARGFDAVMIPNGVEVEAYRDVDEAPLPDDVDLEGPVAGYIGYISERIDLSLLRAVADTGMSMLLVGGRQGTFGLDDEFDQLIALPNVVWVGPKRFEELPSYLRLMDVGLLPYADSDFNKASFPLKTLEYLAAGRPVVATPLPAVQWLDTPLITTAADPDGFAKAVEAVVPDAADPELMQQRRDFAAGHSWASRVEQIADVLGLR